MTILVAVADDDLRERVVDVGIELGEAFDQDLYVVHLTGDEVADADARRVRRDLQELLESRDVEATVAVEHAGYTTGRSGDTTGKQLAEMANDVRFSHVVVGHHSKHVLQSLTQGSTAFTVAESASTPVTIVPPALEADEPVA